jgi:hypothetical protein
VTLADDAVAGLSITRYVAPDCSARLPRLIEEPGVPSPGASVPPLLMLTLPTLPVPASTAPVLTPTGLDTASEPVTLSVPASTVVVPL